MGADALTLIIGRRLTLISCCVFFHCYRSWWHTTFLVMSDSDPTSLTETANRESKGKFAPLGSSKRSNSFRKDGGRNTGRRDHNRLGGFKLPPPYIDFQLWISAMSASQSAIYPEKLIDWMISWTDGMETY
jgi:hypothetical protein